MSFKKCKFYTMMLNRKKMKIEAVQQEGYTDSEFYYYKVKYSNNVIKWFCVEPSTGCSVCEANTRLEAYKEKERMIDAIREKDKTKMIQKFNELLEAV